MMNHFPTRTGVPKSSEISAYLPGSYFHDSWAIFAKDPSLTALEQCLKALSATPPWINTLMSIRNQLVSFLGLKNLGTLSEIDHSKPASKYKPGERVGIFTLIENTPDEVLLGDKDKHLNVVLSVHKTADSADGRTIVTVTTVVHVNNWLGHLYMIPVTPMHRIIAPKVLKAVGGS